MKVIGKIPLWMLLCLFSLSHTTEAVYTSAMPDISRHFQVSGGLVQLSSSVYFFGFALGILSLGRVSDVFGRRPVVLGGIMLFIISSGLIIFIDRIELLIILRFIQAFGASVSSVIAQAMARDSYHGKELTYIYSSISMGLALMPAMGSALGGYIVEYSGWRAVFVFLSFLSAGLLIVYLKFLPETNPYIGISRTNKYFTVLMVVIKDKVILLYAVILGAFNGMMFGFYMEAPFIFINKIGITPSVYGRLVFFLSVGSISGSMLSRYFVQIHVSSVKIMVTGLALSLFACISLFSASFILTPDIDKNLAINIVFIPMMLQMIGHNLLIPLSLRYVLEDYAKVTGTAGSIFGSLYYLLVAVINFLITRLHNENIVKFTLLCLILNIACCISFYLIQKWHPRRQKYEFN